MGQPRDGAFGRASTPALSSCLNSVAASTAHEGIGVQAARWRLAQAPACAAQSLFRCGFSRFPRAWDSRRNGALGRASAPALSSCLNSAAASTAHEGIGAQAVGWRLAQAPACVAQSFSAAGSCGFPMRLAGLRRRLVRRASDETLRVKLRAWLQSLWRNGLMAQGRGAAAAFQAAGAGRWFFRRGGGNGNKENRRRRKTRLRVSLGLFFFAAAGRLQARKRPRRSVRRPRGGARM